MAIIPPLQRPSGGPVEPLSPRATSAPGSPGQLMHLPQKGVDGFSEKDASVHSVATDDAVAEAEGAAPGMNQPTPRRPLRPGDPRRDAPPTGEDAARYARTQRAKLGLAVLLLLAALGLAVTCWSRTEPTVSSRAPEQTDHR